MRNFLLLMFALIASVHTSLRAQVADVLRLTSEQAEALFIKQNLALIAERLNIDMADAAIAQAKLWDNPSLTIDQVNLWTTSKQREGADVLIPPLFGSFARNTQFSVQLSQLVHTAGKRAKLVGMEKVSKEIALREFDELLRGIKLELRHSVSELVYLQAYSKMLQQQANSFVLLLEAYKRQVERGNLSKNELLQLKAAMVEIRNEQNEANAALLQHQKELKILLNLPPLTTLVIERQMDQMKNPTDLSLTALIDQSEEARPDVRSACLKIDYFNQMLRMEKAQRVPNLSLGVNYDRFAGVWKNFIGFGISVDLPIFNRNQGNIKIALINMQQSQYRAQLQERMAQHQVVAAFENYCLSYQFYKEMVDGDFSADLDALFDAYTKNLLNKNISMLEFLNLSQAYKNNKQTVLTAYKKAYLTYEELQYSVGADINPSR